VPKSVTKESDDPQARRPAKPRRRRNVTGEGDVFGDFTPWKNPLAVYAYRCSLVGLTPGLGAVLGPVAVVVGWVALRRFRRDPAISGQSNAVAAMAVGALEFVTNAAGLACLAVGLRG
jgi:hypothetical protein